jgi:sugar lactone lactonase YvrE
MKTLLFGLFLISAVSICTPTLYAQPYTITTIAGSPTMPGDMDGTNANAQFTAPTGLAQDSSRNLFVADGNALRRVSPVGTNWVVTTLAGSILIHGSNDGTNGVAKFDDPLGLAVDPLGNIFVADTLNNAIRKVTPVGTNWVVKTIAGVAGRLNAGWADGTNTDARFANPDGIALDPAGNLYVADSWSNVVRKVTPSGTNWVVSTIAGLPGVSGSANGSNTIARFNSPIAIVADSTGALYVSDFGNNTIRKLVQYGTNWAVTTVAGLAGSSGTADGLGSAARFFLPQGIAVDNYQYLYVADSGNFTIRRITPAGMVSTIAGLPGVAGTTNGTGTCARFAEPYGLTVDVLGNVTIADYLGYDMRQGQLAPVLQYAINGRHLVVSWPLGLTGYVPQITASLLQTNWGSITNPIFLSGEYYTFTNYNAAGLGFYRLHK